MHKLHWIKLKTGMQSKELSMSKRYDRSRQYSELALDAISDIQKQYPACPDAALMSTEAAKCLNEDIRRVGECIRQTNFRGFRLFDFFRKNRNEIAHNVTVFSAEENNKRWYEFFYHIETAKIELKENIKRIYSKIKPVRLFEKTSVSLTGSEYERKQFIDAVEDALNPELSQEECILFPENEYARQTEKLLKPESPAQQDSLDYARGRDGLRTSILTDIVEWITKTSNRIFGENPFMQEEAFIKNLQPLAAEEFSADKTDKLKKEYNKLPSVDEKKRGSIGKSSVDFEFYKNKIEQPDKLQETITEKENVLTSIKKRLEDVELDDTEKNNLKKLSQQIETDMQPLKSQIKTAQKILEEKNILLRNFKNDIEASYTERKNNWELEQIEKSRKSFMQELYDKIARFRKLENLVSPFIEDLGYLWDLSNTPFQDNGFEILQQYASLLENDEFLTELAKLLGRQGRAQSRYEKELRDKIEIITEYEPRPAYRGEISGLRLSNDISAVLPSELALYKNNKTKKYFMLKFAQKQLLSYAYERDNPILRKQITQEEVLVEKSDNEPKGPIIICVDTSGSMHGAPERIAKTVTFALAKIAMNEKRSCYLISFSTGIETLDLSSFKGADALSKLVQFLRMNFNGGTDAAPALTHAVKQLQTNAWKNADVLMVSDFVMGGLPSGLEEEIKSEQEKETGFYSLVIGSDGNKQTLEVFNENWNYNPGNPGAQKELVCQLDTLRRRKTKN